MDSLCCPAIKNALPRSASSRRPYVDAYYSSAGSAGRKSICSFNWLRKSLLIGRCNLAAGDAADLEGNQWYFDLKAHIGVDGKEGQGALGIHLGGECSCRAHVT
jgi:hypothetical protein